MATSSNISNIRFPVSPFIEPATGRPSREWIQWLQNPQYVTQTVNYAIVDGGEINNVIIGNVTPAEGTFTDLTAINGISGGTF